MISGISHRSTLLRLAAAGLLGTWCAGNVLASPTTAPSPSTGSVQATTPAQTVAPMTPGPVTPAATGAAATQTQSSENTTANMTLEQYMQVPVTTNTLTPTPRALVPAAVTTIDRDEIDDANARTLTDLLNAYVPNFEWDSDSNEEDNYGIRGIISGQDNDYLMLVNGRDMNQVTHFGALTERDLVLNGDIQQVDVVRGPGSAVYGAGAVSGVVSQTTYSGLTFQGTGVSERVDAIDQTYSAEIKHGEKLGADTGWFIYGGVAQVVGSDYTYSPIIQGQNWVSSVYGPVYAGKAIPTSFDREGAEYDGTPQIKAHLQWDGDGVTLWARYTRGGYSLNDTDRNSYAPYPYGYTDAYPQSSGVGYEQLTGYAGIKRALTPELTLNAYTSFDVTDYEREITGVLTDSNQERKLISNATINWTGLPNNEAAAGVQYGYYWLGFPSWMTPGAEGLNSLLPTPQRWDSNMLSFLAEDQWHINDQFTLFLTGHADKDRFTDWLLSPRGALVWKFDRQDTAKLIYSGSLRTNDEESMYQQWTSTGTQSIPETERSVELRFERQQTQNLFMGLSFYYNKLNLVGWDSTVSQNIDFGSYKTAGVELEATYRTPEDTITASYGFTKLISQDLTSGEGTQITTALYGYGYNLTNWASSVAKVTWNHRFNSQWSTYVAFDLLWGFNGDQDAQDYLNANPFFGPGTPSSTVAGYTMPYGPTASLNLGLSYKITEHQTLRLDAYNVLGWFDQNLNKEEEFDPTYAGVYRVNAPAFGVTYKYNF